MKIAPTLLLLITLWSCCSLSHALHTVLGGRSGTGKTTCVNKLLGWSLPTGPVSSTTTKTEIFHPIQQLCRGDFCGVSMIDVEGTDSTDGKKNQDVIGDTTMALLKLSKNELHSTVDAFTFFESNVDKLILPRDLQTLWIPQFSESILRSMVVVFNEYSYIPRHITERFYDELKVKLRKLVHDYFPNAPFEIPIIRMDVENATADNLQSLYNSYKSVQPYHIKDLEKMKEKIEKIYQEILANPENYREEIKQIVSEKLQKVTRMVPVRKVKAFTNERVVERASLNLKFLKIAAHKRVKEVVHLGVDEIEEVTEEEMKPFIEEEKQKILKNEEAHYWDLAVKKYEKQYREAFQRAQGRPSRHHHNEL